MKLKRYNLLLGFGIMAVVLAVLLASFAYWPRRQSLDAERIVEAVSAFVHDRAAHATPLPASVSLQELVTGGFLRSEDIKPFGTAEVTISLTKDETHPSQILIQARMPDGSRMAGLADGSVAQLRK